MSYGLQKDTFKSRNFRKSIHLRIKNASRNDSWKSYHYIGNKENWLISENVQHKTSYGNTL